jgi:hypothetical protein
VEADDVEPEQMEVGQRTAKMGRYETQLVSDLSNQIFPKIQIYGDFKLNELK